MSDILSDKELEALLRRCAAGLDDNDALTTDEVQDLIEDCEVTADFLRTRREVSGGY